MKAENKTPIVHEVIGKNAHKKLILNNITPLKYTWYVYMIINNSVIFF